MTDKVWAVRGVSPTLIKRLKRDAKGRDHTLGFLLNAAIKEYLSSDQRENDASVHNRLLVLERRVEQLINQKDEISLKKGVIWFIGLSGSGKTTLCQALYSILKPRIPQLVALDGEKMRAAVGSGAGYREKDRILQFKRVQRLARELARQDLLVLVATLYSNAELLEWNRAHLDNYFEVFVDTPMDLVRQRDTKGLYSKAHRGDTKNVVGIDIPWYAPNNCDMVIDGSFAVAPEQLARQIAETTRVLDVSLEGDKDG